MNGNGTVEHRRLAEMFPARPNDPVMPNWRRLMLELDLRLGTLQAIGTDWQAAIRQINELALSRLNEVLGPAYQQLLAFASLGPGWVLARSSTEMTLQAGMVQTFILDDAQSLQRQMFISTLFLVIQNRNNPADFAVVKLLNYLPASGTLAVQILFVEGNAGPHRAWVIFGEPGVGISDGGTF